MSSFQYVTGFNDNSLCRLCVPQRRSTDGLLESPVLRSPVLSRSASPLSPLTNGSGECGGGREGGRGGKSESSRKGEGGREKPRSVWSHGVDVYTCTPENHDSLGCKQPPGLDVNQSLNAQDAFFSQYQASPAVLSDRECGSHMSCTTQCILCSALSNSTCHAQHSVSCVQLCLTLYPFRPL